MLCYLYFVAFIDAAVVFVILERALPLAIGLRVCIFMVAILSELASILNWLF